ncbi:MAG: hypothetical protein HZB39_10505 [Planctomycetes bacterium]|nr:hypothetical protein [Planctomycetota bacterium]
MNQSLLGSFCILAAALAPLTAQRVIGLERGAPNRLDHIDANTCRRTAVCVLPDPPMNAHAAPLGGTTFDSGTGRIYSSDGRDLVLTSTSCAEYCRVPIPATLPSITGLAYNKARRFLYSSHTDNRIRIWPGGACPTSPLGECSIPVPTGTNEVVTGIEFDNRVDPAFPGGRLFAVTSTGMLYVVHEPVPGSCGMICRTMLPACAPAFTTWQGLTYDPARRQLYVTDGTRLLVIREPASCGLTVVRCCTISSVTAPLSGLAWVSGAAAAIVGQPCADATCASCLPDIGSTGYPSVRNPDFAVTLENLRVGGVSTLVLAFGPPSSGLPLFCGRLWLDPTSPLLLSFPAPHGGGTSGCSATSTVPLGMFPSSTVDLPFTVQAVSLCPAGGLAMSAGLSFTVGS